MYKITENKSKEDQKLDISKRANPSGRKVMSSGQGDTMVQNHGSMNNRKASNQLQMQPMEEEEEMMQMQPIEEEEEMMQPKIQLQAEEEEEEIQAYANDGDVIQRTLDDGHDLASPRFTRNPELEAAYDDEEYIRYGDRGTAVRKLQHALHDLDHTWLSRYGVDGIFKGETKRAVIEYQRRKSIEPDGIVGPITMSHLDADFAPYSGALPSGPWTMTGLRQIFCHWNQDMVDHLATGNPAVVVVDRIWWADETYDGTTWNPNPMEGGGGYNGTRIVVRSGGCQSVAASLYHEYQHAVVATGFSRRWAENEINAYSLEGRWTNAIGIPTRSGFIETDPVTGEERVSETGVAAVVDTYPGISTGSSEEIIEKVGTDRVRVRLGDGTVTVRPARVNDTVPGPEHLDNPVHIDPAEWHCP